MEESTKKSVYKFKFLGNILGNFSNYFQLQLLAFYKDKKIVDLIKKIKKEVDFAFFPIEAFVVYSIAKSQCVLEGDMAEIGVFQGGSAKIICEAKKNRNLHLFDTFSGLPKVSEKDTHFGMKYWKDDQFNNTSENVVKDYLSKYDNVYTHSGKFPETGTFVSEKKFSFVHLDVDLYQSTKDCLDFFYPRLVKGGIILTHDFHTGGVKLAFEEFLKNKKLPVIELSGSQCMIVKVDIH
ncbi:TylF/MycF/NovP-related O-methyltransferase [Nitrosopumilus sp.]|uniref:TylF/MycF/NovP-related O-methyltransferase n=1 Tax=Nitrosopumilus sp. TaxID=2024843 RepID=UPI003D0C888A